MSKPKILVMDIETSPNLGYVWGKWEQDVIEFVDEWHVLSFAYKWLGETQTRCVALSDFKRYKTHPEDDSCVVGALKALLDEADVVVAHNGDRFDIKKVNARLAYHGMGPTRPYKTVDTLKVAKKYFAFNSNKLDDLGEYLGLGRKVKHEGFGLWLSCMQGDTKAWKRMKAYNIQDVILLEKLYYKLLPWMSQHPNLAMYDSMACPKCGKNCLTKNGIRTTQTTQYQQMICTNCGGYARATVAMKIDKPLFTN